LLGTVEPLGVVVLLGVELFGLTLLPGSHGLAVATVVEVPAGCEADGVDVVLDPVVELVELPAPLFAVAEVLPDEGVLLAVVEVPVLLAGVHGATVVEVPVWVCVEPCVPPVTDPALPATPGVPWVAAGLPVVVLPGWDVCSVPMEPEPVVEVVPVEVVPGCVLVVPWDVLVVVLGVAGLGVTEPVLCAVAMPTDSANTDVASKILCIESCSL
jgi:hypothetical protein